MIPAHLWHRYRGGDVEPRDPWPKRVKQTVAPENAHRRYQAGNGPVRTSITAACRDALRTGERLREVTPKETP